MTDTKPPGLAEALAKVQAELKPIRRNTEGQVGQRKRKYADLAAVTETVYPLLGKHGLSFSAKPTLKDGQFVLAYKLRHTSGEEDAGDWPLNGGMPQQVGSEITYARRYCLCAITGAVPEGEDDDGHEAQGARQRFAHTGPEHERLRESAEDRKRNAKATVTKGKAEADEWTTPPPEIVTDPVWLDELTLKATTFTAEDDGRALWRRINKKTEAGGCSAEDAGRLKALIGARHNELVPAGDSDAA